MRFLYFLVWPFCLMSCTPSKPDQTDASPTPSANTMETSLSAKVTHYEGTVTVETGESVVGPLSHADKAVIAKYKLEYFPETDRVKNLDEVEPRGAVSVLFNKPFENYDLRIVNVGDTGGKFSNINAALEKFGIVLSETQIEAASNVAEYQPIRVKTDDISIYLLKVASSTYEIWTVEVPASGIAFKSVLPLTLTRQEIETRLGQPNFRTKDDSVYLYSFFTSLRQFNIIWSDGKIDQLQYVTWDGI